MTAVPAHESHVPCETQRRLFCTYVRLGICTCILPILAKHISARGKLELSEVSYLGCIFPDYFLRYHFFLLFSPLHNAISGLSVPCGELPMLYNIE
jgi:hypothetical protein